MQGSQTVLSAGLAAFQSSVAMSAKDVYAHGQECMSCLTMKSTYRRFATSQPHNKVIQTMPLLEFCLHIALRNLLKYILPKFPVEEHAGNKIKSTEDAREQSILE